MVINYFHLKAIYLQTTDTGTTKISNNL